MFSIAMRERWTVLPGCGVWAVRALPVKSAEGGLRLVPVARGHSTLGDFYDFYGVTPSVLTEHCW